MSLTSGKQLLLSSAAAVSTGSRSLRFNSADSAYLSRTPASAGNRKTWTWAGWVKKAQLAGTVITFAGAYLNSTNYSVIDWSGDTLRVQNLVAGSYSHNFVTTQVFRDPGAWFHLVIASNSSTSFAIYVNGVQVTAFTTQTGPSSTDWFFNSTNGHFIGQNGISGFNQYFNGCLAEIHFCDGTAYDASAFGEFSATTGVWMPKAFTGSYGTNGFKLDFADNSAATAAALGKDTSGNGNNWTPTNLSVTAGAGNDSLVDVPVNGSQTDTGVGGEVRGNYCTLNPLEKGANVSLANGNLDISQSGAGLVTGTIGVSSGKWYWEFVGGTGNTVIGAVRSGSGYSIGNYVGADGTACGYAQNSGTGALLITGSITSTGSGLNNYTAGDVIGVALDLDNGTLKFYKNNTLQNNYASGLTGTWLPATGTNVSATTSSLNFGQRPFAYTAPSGFKALCTSSLPTPTIVKPSTVMDVVLYTGTGSTLTPTSSLGFSPDLVWIKSRSAATDNTLYDIVRGAQARLESNTTDAEVTSDNGLTAFNSAGFTLGTLAQVNTSSATYAAWTWDAGSSTVTNTAGTITSSVRANASAGFSVVTASVAGGLNSPTIGHGLGVTPGLIIAKSRNEALSWYTWHSSFSSGDYILLNSTAAKANNSNVYGTINSSIFTIGGTNTSSAWVSGSTGNYVFYCFAPVAGYSAFGSWQNNGSTDGTFVYLGFRPRFILLKNSDNVERWFIMDSSRHSYNVPPADATKLNPNTADAEGTNLASTATIDFLSNGFKIRTTNTASGEISFGTRNYIYAAFAESPFQYSRAR